MKTLALLCAAVSLLGCTAALAGNSMTGMPGNAKPAASKPAAVKDLWVCPIEKTVIKIHKADAKAPVVAGRRVHFCCAGCPEKFSKMTKVQQKSAVMAAEKMEMSSAKPMPKMK